ncbi:phytase [Caulobacter sp. NIBR2454]|uniref:phytase n=1 Tax=Caulobacter sp. NIBR2454 TaxID=3015996 RepID=UPI0022B6083D|nr:phytase [Caulobacter sp. NIBR2454]
MRNILLIAASAAALAACATGPGPDKVATPNVAMVRETDPVASIDDAADDPAIWRNAADPAASLIVATDKKAGLVTYGLDGKRRDFKPAGRVNNVDLRDGVTINGQPGVLVVASDRNDPLSGALALFSLAPSGMLTPLGKVAGPAGEAYGVCMWKAADQSVFAFLVMKDGTIAQIALDASGAAPTGKIVRTLKLATQSEGCVADDRTGKLYVGEEDVGVWRFDAAPSAPVTATPFAKVDRVQHFADVEGVAIAPQGEAGGLLIASSQGDNAFAVYKLEDASFVGRFRIGGEGSESVQETDGLELMLGDFGPDFPGGLFIAQDGDNRPDPQNFKLTSWDRIKAALGL